MPKQPPVPKWAVESDHALHHTDLGKACLARLSKGWTLLAIVPDGEGEFIAIWYQTS